MRVGKAISFDAAQASVRGGSVRWRFARWGFVRGGSVCWGAGFLLAGFALDQRDQQPRSGQRGQHGAFGFLAGRVGGEEGRETWIRSPVVPGDALATGVQPSHGSDLTRCAGCAPPQPLQSGGSRGRGVWGGRPANRPGTPITVRMWSKALFLRPMAAYFRNCARRRPYHKIVSNDAAEEGAPR